MAKPGRPSRNDKPDRLSVYLSYSARTKLYQLATEGGKSMGRTVEALIERAAAEEALAAAQRALDAAESAAGGEEL